MAAYLVHVDDWVPLLVSQKMKSPHADLAEVARVVLVDIRTVVVLSQEGPESVPKFIRLEMVK